MAFWTALIVSLVLTVAGELLRPKQNPQNAKASGLDDFDLPTAEEGRSLSLFCGKVKINGANVVAYGDLGVTPLTKKVKTGMFSSKRQTYAYRYSLGMQMALAHGDETLDIHEIHFGDSMPRHTRTDEGDGCIRFDFDDVNFYGGDEKEGGVKGTLRFYTGTDTQPASAYLASLTNDTAPAYRGLAHAILEGMYLGTSQYIKTISYVVSRYPNGLGVVDGKHVIGEDANPICFVYELLTNQVWGVGLQGSDIDQVQFRKIAELLHAEGYGVSLLYNGGSSARDIVSDIMRHIDGVVFSDPETGLVSVRVARKDYVVADLPAYGPDDFLEGIDFARPSWLDTKNLVKTTYIDREAEYTTAVISQQDLANISQRGGEVASEDLDFTGFSSYGPAALATARALKTLAYPLARVSGELGRRAWKTKPADLFVLNWPELGIEEVVFRVTRVNYGGTDRNTIGIEAVEDIFAVSDIGYVQPPPSTWIKPLMPPQALMAGAVVDMPYGLEPVEGSVVATFGWRSSAIDQGYAVFSDRSSPFTAFEERNRVTVFTPYATITNAYLATAAAIDAGFTATGLGADAGGGSPPPGGSGGSAGAPVDPINPGFEADISGWTEAEPLISRPVESVWAHETDPSRVLAGVGSLRWTGDSTDTDGSGATMYLLFYHDQKIGLPINSAGIASLRVGVRLRIIRDGGPDGFSTAGVGLAAFDENDVRISEIRDPTLVIGFGVNDSGVRDAVVPFQATPGAAYYRVFFHVQARAGRTILFDSLTWDAVEPGVNPPEPEDPGGGEPDSGEAEFALIISDAGQEWISYSGIKGSTVGPVTRGIFDTPPLDHPAGARVFFASSGYGLENDGEPYTVDTSIGVKLLPYNARGEAPLANAATLPLKTSRRGSRPYPPGRVRVGGVHPKSLSGTTSGTFTLAWAGRNRMHPVLSTQDGANVAPEEGTVYVVRAYRTDTDEILATGEGNMTSASLRLAYTGEVRVEIDARRGDLTAYRPQSFVMAYDAEGTTESRVTVDSAQYVLDGGGAGG